MFHSLLLALGLANPYFHVGDHICTSGFNEFNPEKVLDWYVAKVGKQYYQLSSQFPVNPRGYNPIDSIDGTDSDYHLCTQEELKHTAD